jgi:hypothetical protein
MSRNSEVCSCDDNLGGVRPYLVESSAVVGQIPSSGEIEQRGIRVLFVRKTGQGREKEMRIDNHSEISKSSRVCLNYNRQTRRKSR